MSLFSRGDGLKQGFYYSKFLMNQNLCAKLFREKSVTFFSLPREGWGGAYLFAIETT